MLHFLIIAYFLNKLDLSVFSYFFLKFGVNINDLFYLQITVALCSKTIFII